jgi:hypothetical protein
MVLAILDDMRKQLEEMEYDFAARFKGWYRVQAIALHNAWRHEERPFNPSILEDIENIDDVDHQ